MDKFEKRIFPVGDNQAVIDATTMTLYCGEEVIFQQEIASMLEYSDCRPWAFVAHQWKLVCVEQMEKGIAFQYQEQNIQASIAFEEAEGAVKVTISYINCGDQEICDFTGGFSLFCTGNGQNKVTIPHMIYNDNPSADPERIVPHIGKETGGGLIVEEHRLPIPAVNVEWKAEGKCRYVTLLSQPQVVTGDEREYWSLGVIREEDGERIAALSGPLMFNGMKDVVYGGRCTPLPYLNGYRYVRPAEGITKTFYIGFGVTEEGKGFRSLVTMGHDLLKPHTVAQHSHEEMIDYKKQVLDTRYYKDETCAGYLTFGSANHFGNISRRPEYFLYGWTGQAVKLAWCDCVLGLKTKDHFRLERAQEIIDFFVKNGQSQEQAGLFLGYYLIEKQEWRNVWKDPTAPVSSRIQGESLSDLIEILKLLRNNNCAVPQHWEQAVRDACAFLMSEKALTEDGIYPMSWKLDGTVDTQMKNAAGMPCVWALVKASDYFAEPSYLAYAVKLYETYYDLHMRTFDVPFARATMDAACEDKEAGIYFFTTAAELFRLTREERFKKWASIAADWILTFVFFWETGFQKNSQCYAMNFKTTGWPGVSVQNHHLDVFFPSYEMYAFGVDSDQPLYAEMGKHVSDALTYGVSTKEGEYDYSVVGEQGEHYYHTNYFQIRYPVILKCTCCYRGGMQVWNPSWITAQVMQSAIHFHYKDEL